MTRPATALRVEVAFAAERNQTGGDECSVLGRRLVADLEIPE